jgi:AAA domain
MGPKVPPPEDPQALLKKFLEIGITSKEIEKAADEPIDWVWSPYVTSGSICLVAGNTSGGKTSFIFLLLTARLADDPIEFLGHHVATTPKEQYVIVVEPEHSKGSSARKFRKSAKILGLDPNRIFDRLIIVSGSNALLVGDGRWKQLCGLIAAGLVSDVLLDTIASTTTQKGSDEQAQSELFAMLRSAIEHRPDGVSPPVIWPLTHTRKVGQDGEEEIDLAAVSGSLQRAAQSNTVLMLRSNRKDYRIVSATVFFLKTKEEPPEGFKDHDLSPKTFIATHDRLQLIGKKITGLPDVILDMLWLCPEGLSITGIAERVKRNKTDVRVALDKLVAAEKVEGGTKGGTNGEKGGLFFAVSVEKSKTNVKGGTDNGSKEGGTKGGTKGGRKPSDKDKVVQLSKFRKGGTDM